MLVVLHPHVLPKILRHEDPHVSTQGTVREECCLSLVLLYLQDPRTTQGSRSKKIQQKAFAYAHYRLVGR